MITEIIDSTGDGAGNTLNLPSGLAVDGSGNVYAAGTLSDNAFKITPAGVITQIIDSTGDGAGNTLLTPEGIAVDGLGNVYVVGTSSDNAFKITPGGHHRDHRLDRGWSARASPAESDCRGLGRECLRDRA